MTERDNDDILGMQQVLRDLGQVVVAQVLRGGAKARSTQS